MNECILRRSGMILAGKTEVIGGNPVPVTLRPTKSDKAWHGIEIGPLGKTIIGGVILSNCYFYTSDAELHLVANEKKKKNVC
jgi:hypothetical protein